LEKGFIDVGNIDKHITLFNKRILYNIDSFNNFLLDNFKVEYRYKKFRINELGIKHKTHKEGRSALLQLNYISKELYGHCKKGIVKPIDYIPRELHSLKTAKRAFEFKYDEDFYRLVKWNGANKIMLNNLARYDLNDLTDDNWVKVNYIEWEELGTETVIKSIRKAYGIK
jgi:hypothetical protein